MPADRPGGGLAYDPDRGQQILMDEMPRFVSKLMVNPGHRLFLYQNLTNFLNDLHNPTLHSRNQSRIDPCQKYS
jgi:hypothetical protein